MTDYNMLMLLKFVSIVLIYDSDRKRYAIVQFSRYNLQMTAFAGWSHLSKTRQRCWTRKQT